MTQQDVFQLEQGVRLILSVIERYHVRQEEREKRDDTVDDITRWKHEHGLLPLLFPSVNSAERQKSPLLGGTVAPIGADGDRDHVLQEKEKPAERREDKGSFEITNEEIKKMSKSIKGKFFTQGFAVCWRTRPCGKNSYTYQVRFQRDGYNIQFHDKKKENLKPRFLEELHKQTLIRQDQQREVPTFFGPFANYYFEKFRKVRVAAETYKNDCFRLNRYIIPAFEGKTVMDITPTSCQKLLDRITAEGKGKTADEVFSLMNGIFNCAIKHHFIQFNPLDTVVHIQHDRKNGVPLSPTEERAFVEIIRSTDYAVPFAVILYTGLRPCEYQSARIEGSFIVALNCKRKTRRVEYKKIPLSPMLRPYLADVDVLEMPKPYVMAKQLKKIFPHHSLKDLRTTFNTRCKELHVADTARKAFMGHSQGSRLDDTYTKPSDEFLLQEGEKINY